MVEQNNTEKKMGIICSSLTRRTINKHATDSAKSPIPFTQYINPSNFYYLLRPLRKAPVGAESFGFAFIFYSEGTPVRITDNCNNYIPGDKLYILSFPCLALKGFSAVLTDAWISICYGKRHDDALQSLKQYQQLSGQWKCLSTLFKCVFFSIIKFHFVIFTNYCST